MLTEWTGNSDNMEIFKTPSTDFLSFKNSFTCLLDRDVIEKLERKGGKEMPASLLHCSWSFFPMGGRTWGLNLILVHRNMCLNWLYYFLLSIPRCIFIFAGTATAWRMHLCMHIHIAFHLFPVLHWLLKSPECYRTIP